MTLRVDNEAVKRTRFLVIGCGSIGRRHIKNLRALGADHIVAFDIRADARLAVAAQFKVEPVNTLEEAWAHGPQAAIIATPTSLHVSFAVSCALHRCHIFVEKPLSHTWDGIERLLNLGVCAAEKFLACERETRITEGSLF